MSTSPLLHALRNPVSSIVGGFRYWRAHGARLRRAGLLCAFADGERLRQVRDWEKRSRRLYRRAASNLRGLVADEAKSASDWVRTAHFLLKVARAPYRALAAGLVALAALVGLLALAIVLMVSAVSPSVRARIFPRDLALGQPWVASSNDQGYAREGKGQDTDKPAFFHTLPSENPFIEIDLGAEHVIRRVVIENRTDCCRERALPLNVEIFDGTRWQLIAQRRAYFKTWDYNVGPVHARRVRLLRPGNTYLHLKRISIFGQ